MKLNAAQLRALKVDFSDSTPHAVGKNTERFPIYIILDNIYDTYNIGTFFRLADALNIKRLYICGDSETPPNHKITKASIGTYKIVPWGYKNTAAEAILEIREESADVQVVAVEQTPNSVPYTSFAYSTPLAIVMGSETNGVSEGTLKHCDAAVEIPMFGVNISLNVIISCAIVSFHAYEKLGFQ